jgi:hypothetical protein
MKINTEELKEVRPVNKVYNGDNVHSYPHTFDKVHIEDLEGKLEGIFSDIDCEFKLVDGGLYYKYGNKEPVYITEDRAYSLEESNTVEARRQAYYVLSILDSDAMVTGFRKR